MQQGASSPCKPWIFPLLEWIWAQFSSRASHCECVVTNTWALALAPDFRGCLGCWGCWLGLARQIGSSQNLDLIEATGRILAADWTTAAHPLSWMGPLGCRLVWLAIRLEQTCDKAAISKLAARNSTEDCDSTCKTPLSPWDR